MRVTRKGFGALRRRGMGAALTVLGLLCLTTAGAQAYTWTLDLGVFPSPGSRVVPVNQVTPTPYTTGTEFEVTFNTGTPMVGSIVTLHDFSLPQPINDLDIDFVLTDLNLGLSDLDVTTGNVVPDPTATIDLLGTVTDAGGGNFDITFADFTIYWSGSRTGLPDASGSFSFSLSTLPTTITSNTTEPSLFVFRNGMEETNLPTTCTGGSSEGFDFPVAPNPTDLSDGSRLTMGGATCPSGLSFVSGLEPRPFSIELTGIFNVPEPGTLMLMSTGLVGLAAAGRGRRPKI